MDFQISLAAARVNAKMKQEDTATAMEVTKNTVVNWENGRSEPTISQARRLAELYGLPLNNIFFVSKETKKNCSDAKEETNIYEAVKKRADDIGLSIAELEKVAGIANGTIGGWRNGQPLATTLRKVADVLGCTVNELQDEM